MRFALLLLALVTAGSRAATLMEEPQSRASADAPPEIVLHGFDNGLEGVRTAGSWIQLKIGRDPGGPDEPVLIVDYSAPTANPAGRDVQVESATANWTSGRAISFQAKADHTMRMSLSFLDRNRVAWTAYAELKGGTWQRVRIPFDGIRPNPFFQLPEARTGRPIDLAEIPGFGFAPQDQTSGRLMIGRFVLTQ